MAYKIPTVEDGRMDTEAVMDYLLGDRDWREVMEVITAVEMHARESLQSENDELYAKGCAISSALKGGCLAFIFGKNDDWDPDQDAINKAVDDWNDIMTARSARSDHRQDSET